MMPLKHAAATYVQVTLADMEKFLKRVFGALHPKEGVSRRGNEVTYTLHLGPFVGVRIYTSISRGSQVGAGVGEDAIRVGLVSLKDDGPLEGGKMRIVKRTQNWRDSLQDKIEDCIVNYEDKSEFWENWAETRKRQSPKPEAPAAHRPLTPVPPRPVTPVPSHRDLDDDDGEQDEETSESPKEQEVSGRYSATWASIKPGNSWGVRVEGHAEPGQFVWVVKRSGQKSWIRLGQVAHRYPDATIFRVA